MSILKRFNEAVRAAGSDKDLARINALRFLNKHSEELAQEGLPVERMRTEMAEKIRGPNAKGTAPVYPPAEPEGNFLQRGLENFGAAVRYPEDAIDAAFGKPDPLTGAESLPEAQRKIQQGNLRAGAEIGSFLGTGAALAPFLGPVGAGAMLIGAPIAKRAAEAAGLGESTMVDEMTGQPRDVTAHDVLDDATRPFGEWAAIAGEMKGAEQARAAGVQGPEASSEFQAAKAIADGRALHALAGLGMAANLSPTYRRGVAAVNEPVKAAISRPFNIRQLRRTKPAEAPPAGPAETAPSGGPSAAEILNDLEARVDAIAERGVPGGLELQRQQKDLFRKYAQEGKVDPGKVAALKDAVDQAEGIAPAPSTRTPSMEPDLETFLKPYRQALEKAITEGNPNKIDRAASRLEKAPARFNRIKKHLTEAPPPGPAPGPGDRVRIGSVMPITPAEMARGAQEARALESRARPGMLDRIAATRARSAAARTELDAAIESERLGGLQKSGLVEVPPETFSQRVLNGLAKIKQDFGDAHPSVRAVQDALRSGSLENAADLLGVLQRNPQLGGERAARVNALRAELDAMMEAERRSGAQAFGLPGEPQSPYRSYLKKRLERFKLKLPLKKKALQAAGVTLGAAGLSGLLTSESDDAELSDKSHMPLADVDWSEAAGVPLAGMASLLGGARAKLGKALKPVVDRLQPASRIPLLPEARPRSGIAVQDLEALVGPRETKVVAAAAYPQGAGRVLARVNDTKGLPQNSDFLVKNGVIPAVLEYGAKVRSFEQKALDDILARGYGNLDAEARTVRKLPQDVRRAMNLMIEGRPVPIEERMALERHADVDQLLGYVQRLRQFYRTVGEWRQARGEPVREGDYAPHKMEPWQSRLLEEAGGKRHGSLRGEGSLSHERTTLFDPNRSPLDNALDYLGDIKNRAMNETLIRPISDAAKRFERSGFQAEADTLHEFVRGTLSSDRRTWFDGMLSEYVVSGIKAGAGNIRPGTRIALDGSWGLPEGQLEVKRAGGVGSRGENFYVEVNGKEWPHPYTSVELSFLEMSSTAKGRAKLKLMFGPVAGAIGSLTRMASFFSLWMNPRSVVSQTSGNIGRMLGSDQTWGDVGHGFARTMKLLKDYVTNRESIRDELMRLQRYELFESDALKMDNPSQAWEWVDRIFEAPVIRHGFWPIKAPDFLFKLSTFYGAERRIARENKGWTRNQVERAAVHETLKTTDHTMRLLEAPHSRWAFQQMVMFLRKSQLRDLQQFTKLVAQGKHSNALWWLAGKAGVGAALFYGMGLDRKEVAEVVSRTLPFGDLLVRGGEFAGAVEKREYDRGEPLFPAIDILGNKVWAMRDAAAQSLMTGEIPTEAALRRAAPVAFRTYQDLAGTFLDEDPEMRRKHRQSLILHRAKEHRPEPHGIHGLTTKEEEDAKRKRLRGLRRQQREAAGG